MFILEPIDKCGGVNTGTAEVRSVPAFTALNKDMGAVRSVEFTVLTLIGLVIGI